MDVAMTTEAETACTVCQTPSTGPDLINVGGHPTCRSCLERIAAEVGGLAAKKRGFFKIEKGKYVAGVCGGLADYANMDRDVMRLLALIAIVMTGIFPGVILYVALAFLLPVQPES